MTAAYGSLPDGADERNRYPMADGLLDYFPNALAEVSLVSRAGNAQHNPGEPMHHARWKSTDHANKILRHMIDRGKRDGKGIRHSAYVAWRALAQLQEEIERDEGVPLPRNAWNAPPPSTVATPTIVASILTELSDDDTGLNHGTVTAPSARVSGA